MKIRKVNTGLHWDLPLPIVPGKWVIKMWGRNGNPDLDQIGLTKIENTVIIYMLYVGVFSSIFCPLKKKKKGLETIFT